VTQTIRKPRGESGLVLGDVLVLKVRIPAATWLRHQERLREVMLDRQQWVADEQ